MLTNFTLDDEKSLREWLKNVREGAGYLGILDQEGWTQRHFNGTDDLLKLIDSKKLSCNLYISMACYESPDLKRTQDNASKLCSFWLDLDSHGGGKYESPDQALDDLMKFIAHYSLPCPSYIHHTGHGIHAIWATSAMMSPIDWLPTAQALREIAEEFGLDIDGEVTTDAARVLRIPYTINFRGWTSPVNTKLLEVELCPA
jgi:DNA primase catalytic subunit